MRAWLGPLTSWWLALAFLTGIPLWFDQDAIAPWHGAPAILGMLGMIGHAIEARGSKRAYQTGIVAGLLAVFAWTTGRWAQGALWTTLHGMVLGALLVVGLYLHLHQREGSFGGPVHGLLAVAASAGLALLL